LRPGGFAAGRLPAAARWGSSSDDRLPGVAVVAGVVKTRRAAGRTGAEVVTTVTVVTLGWVTTGGEL
jgi:hypothetical protein